MLDRMHWAAIARSVQIRAGEMARLRITSRTILLEGPEVSVSAEHVLIAAGAWSQPLARQAGDNIPLDTERGYCVEYAMDSPPLSRPVAPRLRAAGTVDLGGLQRPPNPSRLAFLIERRDPPCRTCAALARCGWDSAPPCRTRCR
jgi:D-amino-acid dehydrogenase